MKKLLRDIRLRVPNIEKYAALTAVFAVLLGVTVSISSFIRVDMATAHLDAVGAVDQLFSQDAEPTFTLDTDGLVPSIAQQTAFGELVVDSAKIKVEVLQGGESIGITPKITALPEGQNGEFEIKVPRSAQFLPGKYHLKVAIETPAKQKVLESEFLWGAMAINVDKSSYQQGEQVTIDMSVLSDTGVTICDADLTLLIKTPLAETFTLRTADKDILTAAHCAESRVTDKPDYQSVFKPTAEGTYTLDLTAETSSGTRHLTSTFEVRSNSPYVIERQAAMRAYPTADYRMRVLVTALQDMSGSITERVPNSFELKKIGSDGSITDVTNGTQTIAWPVSLKAGKQVVLEYSYTAPYISPQFYLVGPLEIWTLGNPGDGARSDTGLFREPRSWQIISSSSELTDSGEVGGKRLSESFFKGVPQAATLDKPAPLPEDAPKRARAMKGYLENQKASEPAKVQLTKASVPNNARYEVITPSGDKLTEGITAQSNGDSVEVTVQPQARSGRAGKYTVQAIDPTTGDVTSSTDYTWGVLAFNPDYAVYPANTPAKFAFGVLDDAGRVVCDAALVVKVTDPAGSVTVLATGNATIRVNPDCFMMEGTQLPDYEADYLPNLTGTYSVDIFASTRGGERTWHDTFSVDPNASFYLKRSGPTRTYYPSTYDYSFDLKAVVAGTYQVTEKVPSSFLITGDGFEVVEQGDTKLIRWSVDVAAGETRTLRYSFKGPAISPYLFFFGEAEVLQPSGQSWTEPRRWMLASDNACTSNVNPSGNWNTAASWTSCGGVVPQPADTVTIVDGDTITLDVSASVVSVTINGGTTGGVLTNNGSPFTLTLTGTSGTLFTVTSPGTFTPGTSITVTMNPNASVTTTSGAITFYNLNLTPAIATSGKTYTMGSGALTINGSFNIAPTSSAQLLTVNMGADITVAATGTTTIGGTTATSKLVTRPVSTSYNLSTGFINITAQGTLDGTSATSTITLRGTSGTLFTKTGTFTQGTTEVIVTSASGTPTLLSAATTFHKLTINSTATVINMGAFAPTINNASGAALTITAGVFNASGASITGPGSGNGTFTISAGAAFCLGGTTAATNATCDSGATETTVRLMPTFQTYSFDTTSTVYFLNDAALTGASVISATPAYGNVEFRPLITAARTYTWATASLTINGNWKINPNKAATGVTFTVNMGGTTTMSTTSTLTVACQSTTASPTLATLNFALTVGKISLDRTVACTVTFQPGSSTVTLNATSGTLFTRIGTTTFTQATSQFDVTSASGNVTLLSAATTFNRLTINTGSSSQVVTAGAVITMASTATSRLYIQNGILDDGGSTIVGTATAGATFLVDATGTLRIGSAGTASTFPTLYAVGAITLNAASTVIYQAGVNQTVGGPSTVNYGNLTITPISGTPTYSMGVAFTVSGNLTVNAGTFVTVGFALTGPGSGTGKTFTLAASTTFCLSNGAAGSCTTSSTTAVSMPTFATYAFDSTSTVTYMGNVAMTVAAVTYGNLKFGAVIGAARVYTGAGAFQVNGNLDVLPSAASGTRAFTFNMGGDTTIVGTLTINHGASSTATFNTVSGSGYVLSIGKLVLSAANNTLNINDSRLNVTGTSGTLLTNAGGTFSGLAGSCRVVFMTDASVTLTDNTNWNFPGYLDFTPTITANQVQTFGTGTTTVTNDLLIQADGSGLYSLTVKLANTLTVTSPNQILLGGSVSAYSYLDTNTSNAINTGEIVIYGTGGLIAGSSTITLSAILSPIFQLEPSGSFSAGTSTVVYNGVPNSSVNIFQGAFTGSNALYNFTLSPALAASRTYNINDQAMEFTGDVNLAPTATAGSVTATVNLGGDVTVASGKTLTINAGDTNSPAITLDTRPLATDYNITTGFLVLGDATGGADTLDASSSASVITLTGTSGTLFTKPGTFTVGTSEVKVTSASGTPSLLSAATTFHKLTINAPSATVINDGAAVTVQNVSGAQLYVQAGVFNASAAITGPGSGNGTLDIDSGATLCLGGTAAATTATCDSGITATTTRPLPTFQTYTLDANSTVRYLGDVAETVSITPTYGNLAFTPKLTAARTYTLGTGTLNVAGNLTSSPTASSTNKQLTINPAGDISVAATGTTTLDGVGTGGTTLDLRPSATDYNLSTGKLTITSTGAGSTLDAASAASTITLTATSGTLFTRTGTFTQGTSTVAVTSASGSPTLLSAGTTFHRLTINAGTSVVAGAAITMSSTSSANRLYVQAGTLDDGGSQIAGTSNGTIQVDAGATLRIGDATGSSFPTNYTSGNITLSSTSTVVYDSSAAQTISSTPASYGHLQLSTPSGTPTKTLGGNIVVDGNLTIDASNTLDSDSVNDYDITLKGNFTNNGTFTAQQGIVLLSGTGTQTLSGTMTGGSAFYDLTISNSSGANASDCERTGFTASVDFDAAAQVTNTYTITTASVRVEYQSGATYTFNNINWNGQATGTRIYFRNSAATGTWLLNVSGTQVATSYINVSRSDASGGNQIGPAFYSVDCNNNTNWLINVPPDSPASLVQKRVTAGTTMSTGDWTNETQVQFTASASDPDASETLYLCVEVDLLGVTFSDTEDQCGTGVSYTGSPVTVTTTLTGITDAQEYHWQVRVKDTAGAYSSWVQYGGNAESARDFGVDTTAPTGGTVNDGTGADQDQNDGSLTDIAANWSGFNLGASGLLKYEYAVRRSSDNWYYNNGTTTWQSGESFVDNTTNTSFNISSQNLRTSELYYITVRVTDNAANQATVNSDGQEVLPTISFSYGSAPTFAPLNSSNSYTDTKSISLTTSTNASTGYVIQAYLTDVFRSQESPSEYVSHYTGTWAAPTTWGGGTYGFGYTSDDTLVQGSNRFSGGTKYAGFGTTAPGNVVADHTDAVNGSTGAVTNEVFNHGLKVAVPSDQTAGTYKTNIVYIVTANF